MKEKTEQVSSPGGKPEKTHISKIEESGEDIINREIMSRIYESRRKETIDSEKLTYSELREKYAAEISEANDFAREMGMKIVSPQQTREDDCGGRED